MDPSAEKVRADDKVINENQRRSKMSKLSKKSKKRLANLTPAQIIRVKSDPFKSGADEILETKNKADDGRSQEEGTDAQSMYDRLHTSLLCLMIKSRLLDEAVDKAISRYVTMWSHPSGLMSERYVPEFTSTDNDEASATNESLSEKTAHKKSTGSLARNPRTTNVTESSLFRFHPDQHRFNETQEDPCCSKMNMSRKYSSVGILSNYNEAMNTLSSGLPPVESCKRTGESRQSRVLYHRVPRNASFNKHELKSMDGPLLEGNTNNNHPGTIEDVSTDNQEVGSSVIPTLSEKSTTVLAKAKSDGYFGYDLQVRDLPATRSCVDERVTRVQVLVPVGGPVSISGPVKTIAKWTDIAAVMHHGTRTHKNVDPYKVSRCPVPSTLTDCMLTSVMSKMKLFAVKSLRKDWVSLEDLLKINTKGRIFAETHAKFVCVNLLLALRFLHENNIFHGSVYPRKVVINEKGYPFLTGFNTTDVMDERQSRPRERLPVEYSSADQLYQDFLTEETDIFSTGELTYAMVYGRTPHEGEAYADTRRNILDHKFVPSFEPETMSEAGKRFIIKCIRKNERRRFSILHCKKGLFEAVPWFAGLSEDKLYKQTLFSPLVSVLKKIHTKSA